MPVSLADENRVAIPPTVLSQIGDLNRNQSTHVQSKLLEITKAGYTPEKLVYKHYGDLKVFRCGNVVRIFGAILENLTYISDFDHLVILIHISEHDYESAGVERSHANKIQTEYSKINSEKEFYDVLDGDVFDSNMIEELI